MLAGWKMLCMQRNLFIASILQEEWYLQLRRLLDGYSYEAEMGHLVAWLCDQKKKFTSLTSLMNTCTL